MNDADKKAFEAAMKHCPIDGIEAVVAAKWAWKSCCEWRDSQVGEPAADKFEAMHGDGVAWITTIAAAQLARSDTMHAVRHYERILEDHRQLVRELDLLINGEKGAAQQASLCDIVAQVKKDGLAPTAQINQAAHPDDEAVDKFAHAMKQKLAQAREKGRSGWQQMTVDELSTMLREHVEKGDPRDVANFCMFIWHKGVGINQSDSSAQINQQLLSEALESVETVLADAYHRHFAECCGRGQGGCCGDFIEQWTPEDHKILDTLSPIQRKLQAALQAARGA